MTKAEIHTTLVAARDIMAERGLMKGFLKGPKGEVCLRGAILEATYPLHTNDAVLQSCEAAMGFHSIGWGSAEPVLWNNAPERTLEEVLARFDAAIQATAPEPPRRIPTPACQRRPGFGHRMRRDHASPTPRTFR